MKKAPAGHSPADAFLLCLILRLLDLSDAIELPAETCPKAFSLLDHQLPSSPLPPVSTA